MRPFFYEAGQKRVVGWTVVAFALLGCSLSVAAEKSGTTKSEEFAKQAEILAQQAATIESKQGISCNCPSHFRYFSKLYVQEAAGAQAEAERQERLAQERLAQEYSEKQAARENK